MKHAWVPGKTEKRDFAIKMQEIKEFCLQNKIEVNSTNDSYYFTINDQKYRVSNHASKKNDDIFHIHASKLRIIEIYTNLKYGVDLDHKGNPKCLKCV